ncbi:hypothetical protein EON80_28045 [bacterium]|nr:MAG: hypothetical protein EON80_28045 [bacterium]
MAQIFRPQTQQLTTFQLLRRMIGWGIAMAFLWSWIPVLCVGCLGGLYLLPAPEPPQPTWDEMWKDDGNAIFGIIMIVAFWLWFLLTIAGGIVGAGIAIWAPATESKNPFVSAFFWLVGLRTFWYWLLMVIGTTCIFIWLYQRLESVFDVDQISWVFSPDSQVGGAFLLLFVSLWLAIQKTGRRWMTNSERATEPA